MQAYVLIQTEANREPIAESVRGIPGVISAEDLSGPFDAIALARSGSTRGLTEQVVAEIQKLPGVIRALSAPLIGSLDGARTPEPGGRFGIHGIVFGPPREPSPEDIALAGRPLAEPSAAGR